MSFGAFLDASPLHMTAFRLMNDAKVPSFGGGHEAIITAHQAPQQPKISHGRFLFLHQQSTKSVEGK